MKETLAEIARQLAELTAEVRAGRADTASLAGDIDELRREVRDENKAIRADLAMITSLQNSDIAANKKKLPGWSDLSALSTGD